METSIQLLEDLASFSDFLIFCAARAHYSFDCFTHALGRLLEQVEYFPIVSCGCLGVIRHESQRRYFLIQLVSQFVDLQGADGLLWSKGLF